jgi:hypothetical protein
MGKHREVHPEEVENCFGCKVMTLVMDPGASRANGVPTAKAHDKELGAYYDAVRQGIEPRSTRQPDIDAAVRISNEGGKAFDGINLTYKE